MSDQAAEYQFLTVSNAINALFFRENIFARTIARWARHQVFAG